MSIKRYQNVQDSNDNPRVVEHRALARVTGMLMSSAEARGPAFAEACHMNRMLWTVFQTDLAHPDNRLPETLKAQLISLSMWVQRYTGKVLLEGAGVDPLVSVNRSIMEGLAPPAREARAPIPQAARA